jgi:hypothetical protein
MRGGFSAVHHLSPAIHHRHLDLVAVHEEAPGVLELEIEIVLIGARPELHLLQGGGVALALAGLLLLLVLVPPVVHDATHGRSRAGRDLDQVEAYFLRLAERIFRSHDSELLAFVTNHANLRGPDHLVDPRPLVLGVPLEFSDTSVPPGTSAPGAVHASDRPHR